MRLQTRNLFIDTSVFISQNFIEGSKLLQLIEMGRLNYLHLLITKITYNEIVNRIEANVRDSMLDLIRFQKSRYVLRNAEICQPLFDTFDQHEISKRIIEKLNLLIIHGKVTILDYLHVDIENIFNRYFSNDVPFNNIGKKNEFPDAFVLAIIEQWCIENATKCYCLSNDKDMQGNFSSNLITIEGFNKFLDSALREFEGHMQHTERIKEADNLLEENIDDIKELIKSEIEMHLLNDLSGQFEDSDIDYVVEVEVTEIETLHHSMIFINAQFAKVELEVDIKFTAVGSFDDYEEDEDAFPNNITETITKRIIIPVALTLNYNPPSGKEFRDYEVESINGGRRIRV